MSVVDQTSGTSYSTLSEAIAGSSANDVIQISAGSYVENFPDITHNLTIEAVGGLAYLSNPQPDPPNGRAVINVPGNLNVSLTLNGLDISGAVDDASNPPSSGGANGAGILFESGNGALDVENCHIHNNEDGILTGSANTASLNGMTVTITNSEIDNNGVAPSNIRYGFDHNIYTGSLTQLTVTDSYIHDALGGHEIKSHADNTIIMDSRIQDGPTAGTSYSVDLEVGGVATIENNVIEKGPNAQNDAFIHYGGDVPTVAPNSSLTISDNTVIDDKASGQGPFVFDQAVFTDGGPIVVPTISGNTFYGPGPDNLLAGPNFGDGQSGAPYAPINTFLLITNAPPLDTSPPSAIPFLRWTTASNAAVAQAALAALQSSVTGGSETVVSYTGGSTLPALPTPTVTGIVVALGAGTAAHGPILLNGKYDVGISDDTSASPAAQSWQVGVGAANDTVMVGGGGGSVLNSGTNTQIFMTGQSVGTVPSPQIIDEVGVLGAPSPSAEAWVDGNATLDGSAGSTTIHLDTVTGSVAGFASTIIVDNSGVGLNTINIATSSAASGTSSVNVFSDVIGLSGNSSVAATVNAGGSAASGAASTGTQQAEVLGFLSGSANGVFNGGAANVILFGAGAPGSATLFGGSGTDIDAGAGGLIEAGTGGHSLLFGSFTQATTLVGGSSTDILASISLAQKNTTMIAGSGAETLASFNQGAVFQGVGVSTLMGQGSIAPSTTNMIGEIGGNSFQIGAGATQVQANNLGVNTYEEGLSAANGVATITGFDLGSDTVSLTNPAGGKYALGGTGPTGLTFTTGGSDTTVHFGDGTTWTVVGATLTNNNFG